MTSKQSGKSAPVLSESHRKAVRTLAHPIPSEASEYSTKELNKNTLADFERLFEKHPAPGAFTCWCMYHHQTRSTSPNEKLRSRAEVEASNRRERRKLVENGESHGILVYSKDEPVGWCQFGSFKELPRIDNNPSYRRLVREDSAKRLWRITCFTVDRNHRERGVATAGLEAALRAIKAKGGGLVEAYPIVRRGAYREYLGTVSMFRKAGFKIVAPFGKSNVLMRRSI